MRTKTTKHSNAANATSKSVSANGVTLTMTKATAMEEYAFRTQDAASTAQYRFTENERKSTENPMIARTAMIAETKDTVEEFEKMKKPATIVKRRQVSEYAARTPARSFE